MPYRCHPTIEPVVIERAALGIFVMIVTSPDEVPRENMQPTRFTLIEGDAR